MQFVAFSKVFGRFSCSVLRLDNRKRKRFYSTSVHIYMYFCFSIYIIYAKQLDKI